MVTDNFKDYFYISPNTSTEQIRMHKNKIKHETSRASPIFDLQLYVVTLPVVRVVELELLKSRTLDQSFSK